MPRAIARTVYTSLVAGMLAVVILAPTISRATIEEQRARLPPPAFCQDPVEGVWRAAKYRPAWGEWTVFTLSVHRSGPGLPTLQGSIENHGYSGLATQLEPPPCAPNRVNTVIAMPSVGTFADGVIDFRGTSWRVAEQSCLGWPGYNLDHFSGTIDRAIQEFQTVNNDGGQDVNEPFVFRRIRCFDADGPSVTRVNVSPPALLPPRRGRGCSRE